MKPKFMSYAANKEQLVQWQLIYKNLSGRQKVKWRKEMHRAIKARFKREETKTEEIITINV